MDKCFDCVHYHKCFQNQRSVVVSKGKCIVALVIVPKSSPFVLLSLLA